MKRKTFFVLAGMVGLWSGCNKNEPQPIIPEETAKGITTISAQQMDTKVSLTDAGSTTSVDFKSGDKLYLIRPVNAETWTGINGAEIPFTIASGIGTKVGIFNADGAGITSTGIYYAIHPGTGNTLSVTTGTDGYFTIQLDDTQFQSAPAGGFSNAENYMCFFSAVPVEVADPLFPPATTTPISFPLKPMTSVLRFHLQDEGGYTAGRTVKNIFVRSVGGDYFGSRVSFYPDGNYNTEAPFTDRVTTNYKKLDLSALPGGGMTLNSTLTQAGCLALYCLEGVYSSITNYSYILQYDNGTIFTATKPKVRPWLPGAVYETAVSVDGPASAPPTLTDVQIASSAGYSLNAGAQTNLLATVTPVVAALFFQDVQWQIQVGSNPYQDIPGANALNLYSLSIPTGSFNFRIKITDVSGTVTYSAPITIVGSLATPPTTGTQLATGYAGAFWRYNEKGERIIRIPVSGTANIGPWSAFAAWYDAEWDPASGDGMILDIADLDPVSLASRGITWNAATEDPNSGANGPENHLVTGVLPIVMGTASEGDVIEFRIGLQQNFAAYNPNTNPARYAMVLLNYGAPVKTHRIYIRQGEGADYVMLPSNSPEVMKFSPYNLTAATLNDETGIMGGSPNPGIFTDYPSQAGAYFQWAHNPISTNDRTRFAWEPYTALGAGLTPSWQGSTSNFPTVPWTSTTPTVASAHETCPAGYRRPNDGTTTFLITTPVVAMSEVRQSLYSSPPSTTSSSVVNSVWGYYADGFFDRREITGGPAGSTSPGVNSSVSVADRNIAHIGRLFFNPTTQASLFFPAAGYRTYNTGTLTSAGATGYYPTTTTGTANYAWTVIMTNTAAQQAYSNAVHYKSSGNPIRCVKDECKALTQLDVTRSGAGDLAIGTTVTLTTVPTPANAFLQAFQWQQEIGGIWQDIPGATNATYSALITIEGNNSFRVKVTHCSGTVNSDPMVITGLADTPANSGFTQIANANGYVGAFWRYNEKGERIVRIPITGTVNVGPWIAYVRWHDANWNPTSNDGVVLDTDDLTPLSLASRGITWDAATEDPNSGTNGPENHLLASGQPVIFGSADEGDVIEFRIGLQQHFAAYNANTNPARYALVVISYGTPVKRHRIFIRQGEGDDYVMHPVNDSRPVAVKFSPFNLTAATLDDETGINGAPPNPGIFTDYPSQAGAFFQWAHNPVSGNDRTRFAWNPFIATGAGLTPSWVGNNSNFPTTTWLGTGPPTVSDDHETCPAGYRRVMDGSSTVVYTTLTTSTTPALADSELRQSLYSTPPQSATSNVVNSVWGYYADGFFDRREITGGPVGSTTPGTNSTVSVGNRDIAHIGRVFFNPTSLASLFFPAAGSRIYNNGNLSNAGMNGQYMTTSSYNANYIWNMVLTSTAASQAGNATTYFKSTGGSIRCVKN